MKKIFYATDFELRKINLHQKYINEIMQNKNEKEIKKEIDLLRYKKVNPIFINEKEYPDNLKEIENPPFCIYCIGNTKLLNKKGMAIIGSRNSSEYGRKVAREFSKELSKRYVIISGLALGIDAEAHKGSLDNSEGETIAVIGSGLDVIYPKENFEIYERILKNNGLIVSEYRLGINPLKENFPMRNRIISGLSSNVLIVEAGKRSGSLITAEFALNQGKDIYVIPGNIYSKTSKGTNSLIKEGAILVDTCDEIK